MREAVYRVHVSKNDYGGVESTKNSKLPDAPLAASAFVAEEDLSFSDGGSDDNAVAGASSARGLKRARIADE